MSFGTRVSGLKSCIHVFIPLGNYLTSESQCVCKTEKIPEVVAVLSQCSKECETPIDPSFLGPNTLSLSPGCPSFIL